MDSVEGVATGTELWRVGLADDPSTGCPESCGYESVG